MKILSSDPGKVIFLIETYPATAGRSSGPPARTDPSDLPNNARRQRLGSGQTKVSQRHRNTLCCTPRTWRSSASARASRVESGYGQDGRNWTHSCAKEGPLRPLIPLVPRQIPVIVFCRTSRRLSAKATEGRATRDETVKGRCSQASHLFRVQLSFSLTPSPTGSGAGSSRRAQSPDPKFRLSTAGWALMMQHDARDFSPTVVHSGCCAHCMTQSLRRTRVGTRGEEGRGGGGRGWAIDAEARPPVGRENKGFASIP